MSFTLFNRQAIETGDTPQGGGEEGVVGSPSTEDPLRGDTASQKAKRGRPKGRGRGGRSSSRGKISRQDSDPDYQPGLPTPKASQVHSSRRVVKERGRRRSLSPTFVKEGGTVSASSLSEVEESMASTANLPPAEEVDLHFEHNPESEYHERKDIINAEHCMK